VVDELTFVSLAADSAAGFWRAIADRLGARFIDDVPWQAREQLLVAGEVDLGVVCGLQYVLARESLELLAAPVMRAPRYQDRPIYFSDVVVRQEHPARRLDDLRGATWAINEPTSQSGYNITRYVLAARGESSAFFGRVIESGAHERSLELLLAGHVDASAIDSTVLESIERPTELRVIESLGPSPIPPVVAARSVAPSVRAAVRSALLRITRDPVARFVAIEDADYDPIRHMARVAQRLPEWRLEPAALHI
jgi:phosphonate transport system substrate-binding protein